MNEIKKPNIKPKQIIEEVVDGQRCVIINNFEIPLSEGILSSISKKYGQFTHVDFGILKKNQMRIFFKNE